MTIADARYIRFANRRRNGAVVATPVWVAALDDEVVFSTHPDAGKVKRLRNDPWAEVSPSDVRGRVAVGAPVHEGAARLLDPAEHQRATDALARKYGIQWRLLGLGQMLRRVVGKDPGTAFIAVRLGDVVRHEGDDTA